MSNKSSLFLTFLLLLFTQLEAKKVYCYEVDSCIIELKIIGVNKYMPGYYRISLSFTNNTATAIGLPLYMMDYPKNDSCQLVQSVLVPSFYMHEPYSQYKIIEPGKKGRITVNTSKIEKLQTFEIIFLKNFLPAEKHKKLKNNLILMHYEDIDVKQKGVITIEKVRF